MITHIKENTNKCNHTQHLKYVNKVLIKYYGNQDTYFSCNKENLRAYKKRLHEVREMKEISYI
jgi:histone deacetylase complex regulatory component SIN3